MNRKLLALLLATAALVVSACGDDDEEGDSVSTGETPTTEAAPTQTEEAPAGESGAGDTQLTADADPGGGLKFTTDTLEAPAGKVTITMNNPSELPHAIEIEGNGVEEEGETVEKGGKSVVSAELEPGEYKFYCPVPGHEEGGMVGTLTVK